MHLIRQICFGLVGLLIAGSAYAQVGGAPGGARSGKNANTYTPFPEPSGCSGFTYSPGSTHDDLRGQTGSAGETACLTGNSRYEGGFDYQASDPYSNGDDSTLVIAASGGGFWVRDFDHTPGDPIQLGWYEKYVQNVNITHWLISMATNFSPFLYVEATTVSGIDTVHTDHIDFQDPNSINANTDAWITDFGFYEDSDTLVIKMDQTNSPDREIVWDFHNYNNIDVGGPNLWLIFKGDHPGLGIGDGMQSSPGMINLNQDDNWATSDLVKWRANIHDTRRSGLNLVGRSCNPPCGSNGRANEVIIWGEMWNGGVRANSGIRNVYYHPDSTWSRNPYHTNHGWDGTVASGPVDGVDSLACPNQANRELRGRGGAGSCFTCDKVTGGVTLEYGSAGVAIFNTYQIGNSESDPFVIKYKNIGATGPTARTGLPEYHIGKKTVDYTLLKHDPLSGEIANNRWVKFVQLENDHANGSGMISQKTSTACANGNGTNVTGYAAFWRAEASRDGVSSQYITSHVNVQVERSGGSGVMNDDWIGGQTRPTLNAAGSGADCTPGPTACDRTYGHTIVLPAGETFGADIHVMDSDSIRGTGTVTGDITVNDKNLTDGAGTDYCRNVVIQDITANGDITIETDCDGTQIKRITMPSTSSIVASESFDCNAQGTIAAGTYNLSNSSHRTTLGASGGDPYAICPD